MNGSEINFLEVDDVLRLHRFAIEDQGGDPGLRDRGLLESAIAMPRQQFGGQYLHEDVPAMAAAYAFHLCKNHPFIDGNKRAAFGSLVGFLAINNWRLDASPEDAETTMLRTAAGDLDKQTLTQWVQANSHMKPRRELREFFARVESEMFLAAFQAARPDSPGNSPAEFQATADDVAKAMPFVQAIIDVNKSASRSNDEQQRLVSTGSILTIIALYRLAEDMGYEW